MKDDEADGIMVYICWITLSFYTRIPTNVRLRHKHASRAACVYHSRRAISVIYSQRMLPDYARDDTFYIAPWRNYFSTFLRPFSRVILWDVRRFDG
jgi:hypothetical protein